MNMLIGQNPPAPPTGPTLHTGPGHTGPAGAAPAASGAEMIVDGDQKTFMTDVIQASRSMPVLVDFWATWCGPCKQLTPALEKVTRAAGGRIKLVKIDIDKNRGLVQQLSTMGLPLQSVPTVVAFWQGQVADLIQGALSESELKRFVEALLKMAGGSMPGADLLEEARDALETGDTETAMALFGALLQQEPENGAAWGGLIRTLITAGQEDEAQAMLEQVPPALAEHAEIASARSALALAAEGREATGQLQALQARLAADPNDNDALYDLATALNAMGQREEAADALLQIIRRDRAWREDGARQQLLKFFEAWGFEDPAAVAGRRKLSTILFS